MCETTSIPCGVLIEVGGGIVTVTLSRPQRRNAINPDIVSGLNSALDYVETNDDARVVILRGAETGFCAGSDLKVLAQLSPEEQRDHEASTAAVARRIADCPVPVIAAVHGFAIGGGAVLAACCDIVITDGSAEWRLPEADLGWVPPWGMWALLRRCGRGNTLRVVLDTRPRFGGEAAELGLADVVCNGPLEAAASIAANISAHGRHIVTVAKSTLVAADFESADRSTLIAFQQALEARDDGETKGAGLCPPF